MPRFFIENASGETITVRGADAAHIACSLRMKTGERLTVCGGQGTDFLCEILSAAPDEVALRVVEEIPTQSEPSVRVTLYQGLPKGDKLEWIIEKTVELGVTEIVPVLMQRSVSRPDQKSAAKKHERYQKLALSAAKQSGRGIVPTVRPMCSFRQMCEGLSRHDAVLFFYELGGAPLADLLSDAADRGFTDIAVVIGPEGGFDPAEAEALQTAGAFTATLGKRILRTETAPLAALSVIMYATGNMQ